MGKIGIVHKARNRKAGAFLHGRQHGNDLLHAARTRPVWVDNREQRKAKPVEMRLKPAQRPRARVISAHIQHHAAAFIQKGSVHIRRQGGNIHRCIGEFRLHQLYAVRL